jgi:hypothetical protein
MDQQPADPAVKVLAFASGLRRNVAATGRRWAQWPGGPEALAVVVDCIDYIQQRLHAAPNDETREAVVAACMAELRAILEWTTYQSASLATARALMSARKIRSFAKQFGLLEDRVSGLGALAESEDSLIENVETKTGYMFAIADRYPHLELPRPLVEASTLAPPVASPPGKLALIQQLLKSTKRTPGPR